MKQILMQNKDWIDETWEKTLLKLRRNSELLKYKIPLVTNAGIYDDHNTPEQIIAWTNGFWPGIMWLMYAATGEETFRETAENSENALDAALEQFLSLHHDVGFMWHISAGANYLLTGSEKSKNRNLHAASVLATRYNAVGQFIRAWDYEGVDGWTIIDSMMNLSLLYWASDIVKNPSLRYIAMNHADKTLANHIRPDGSVIHMVQYDIQTGECRGVAPNTQGFDSQTSSWSRGQAWAIYGFIISYLHTGEARYLDAAKKVAHYFIANVSTTDYIPLSDFRAPEEPVYIDTSAGAIAACGLIEIARVVPELEKNLYMQAAVNIMKALVEKHCDWSEEEQAILQNSSAGYSGGVHEAWIYGEYYFVEAMYKLKGFEPLFW